MSRLSRDLVEGPLGRVTLPGSHDSAAYRVDDSSPCVRGAGDCSGGDIAKKLPSVLWWTTYVPYFHRAIHVWTLTQTMSIRGQLDAGIRFLDLRVAWDAEDTVFVTSHTLRCGSLATDLIDVANFLVDNPTEVVVVSVCADWPVRDSVAPADTQAALFDLMCRISTLSDHAFERSMGQPTIGAMRAVDRRCLFIVGRLNVSSEQKLWGEGGLVNRQWDDTNDVARKRDCVNKRLDWCVDQRERSTTGCLRAVDFCLTASTDDVAGHLKRVWRWPHQRRMGLVAYANATLPLLQDAYTNDKKRLRCASIVMFDHVTEEDARGVFSLNYSEDGANAE